METTGGGGVLILALDLSLNSSGFAVISYEDEIIRVVEKGIINNKKVPSALIGKKLCNVESCLNDLFDKYVFDVIVKEASFNTGRIKSTQRTFQVFGVVLETCYKNGYTDITEIAATTIKKLVGGSGKCTKDEVKDSLYYYVGFQDYKTEDVSDAVATGVAYFIKNGHTIKLREVTGE